MIPIYIPYKSTNQSKYVNDCLDTNQLTHNGDYIPKFESGIASLLDAKHCIATMNGTVSLYAIYLVEELKGKTVVTSTMTYAATVSQLLLVGAKVLLTDCDSNLQMNLTQLKQICRENKVDAVVVPEVFSDCPDMDELQKIATKYGIIIYEDSAESFGCKFNNKSLGTYGRASSFSFFANKNITTGEGGCIITEDDILANELRSIRNQYASRDFNHEGIGSNFRMTNLQAAIGVAQLEDWNKIVNIKAEIAADYRCELNDEIKKIVPKTNPTIEWMPVFELSKNFTAINLKDYLMISDIDMRTVFRPIHTMSAFKKTKMTFAGKESERLYRQCFILPCYPDVLFKTKLITKVVNEFFTHA